MRKVAFALSVWLLIPTVLLATWAEPTCDPAADPTLCNISAPINVSTSDQTKSGGLKLDGALITNSTITANGSITAAGTVTVNSTGSLTVNGNSTLGASTSGALIVNGISSTFNSLAIFNSGMDVASKFNYTGPAANFTITADSINDSEVSNTLTASIFRGTGSTSDAVDLGDGTITTGEVSGILPSTSVGDAWVNNTGDTMSGTLTINPTTGRAIAIQPNTTSDGIWISGATGEALVSLNQTGNGRGIYLNTITGVTGKGIEVVYAGSGYPVHINSTGSSTRSLNVENGTTGGYGVYSKAGGTNGTGVAGTGTLYGTVGASTTGTGGFFITDAVGGTGLYATLNSTATTTSSKALEVVGKNGYGAYITADGSAASTALYAGNTGTGVGLYVTGAGSNVADIVSTTNATDGLNITTEGIGLNITTSTTTADATGIVISASGGQKGIVIDASATGIDVDTTNGLAIEANTDDIHTTGGYRGGQFYPAGNNSGELYANAIPDLVDTISIIASPSINVNGLMFDGSDIWVAAGFHSSTANSVAVQRINAYTGQLSAYYNNGTAIPGSWSPGAIVYADDRMYVFADTILTTEYLRMYLYSDSVSSANLTTALDVRSGTYDGEDIWLGTSNSIYKLVGRSTQTLVKSSVGEINDIIFADGYIWAMDTDSEVVYQIDRDTNSTVDTITIGTGATDMEFDGQFLWVANDTDESFTKINVSDNSTSTVSVSTVSSGIDAITFDGVHLWLVSGATLHGYNVASETIDQSVTLSGSSYNDAIFDGSYVWVADGSSVDKVSVGRGYGYSMPAYPRGIMLFGNDDLYHCIYFDSTGAIQDSTGLSNCM